MAAGGPGTRFRSRRPHGPAQTISEPGLRRIREMERFQERLAQVIDPGAIADWLEAPNAAFDGLKPLEVIERGEIDRLWAVIYYLESGISS
jgi:hypothetical protein